MRPRAAFARPGPGVPPFPGVTARMRPSDSPAASAPAVVPLAEGVPRVERFSEPAGRAFEDARRVGGVALGPPQPQFSRGPSGASQVTGPSSSHAPRLQTPPGGGPPHPLPVETPAAFRVPDPLGSRDSTFSRLGYAAHGLAYLRIPRDVTATRARLTTDLPG